MIQSKNKLFLEYMDYIDNNYFNNKILYLVLNNSISKKYELSYVYETKKWKVSEYKSEDFLILDNEKLIDYILLNSLMIEDLNFWLKDCISNEAVLLTLIQKDINKVLTLEDQEVAIENSQKFMNELSTVINVALKKPRLILLKK